MLGSWSSSIVFLLLSLHCWRFETPVVKRMFLLLFPDLGQDWVSQEGCLQREEEVMVTKSEGMPLQDRQVTISSNNITIKLETKMVHGNMMFEKDRCEMDLQCNSSRMEHT